VDQRHAFCRRQKANDWASLQLGQPLELSASSNLSPHEWLLPARTLWEGP